MGLHETGEDPTKERQLQWKVRTVFAFCLRTIRLAGWCGERGQDPRASFGRSVTGWPGRQKGNPTPVLL